MEKTAAQNPIMLAPNGGPTLAFMGVDLAYKVTSHETDGAWALLEYTMPPKFIGPPPHWHKVTSESFYVLEGRVTFKLGTQVSVGEPGTFVHVPTHTVHKFSNDDDQPARFLTFILPGGFENYFKALVAFMQSEPTWPPKDTQKLLDLYQRYDIFSPDEL